jgi:hypothetical protein
MDQPLSKRISRREFLKLAGLNLGALLLPAYLLTPQRAAASLAGQWPSLSIDQLPARLADIISRTPEATIDPAGYYYLSGKNGLNDGRVPLARTRWTLQNNKPRDRLVSDATWGIVLHWFGDAPEKNLDLDGYLRGFNGRRREGEELITTSAHFLVGEAPPTTYVPETKVGVIQTQAPDVDGTPFLAAHLRGLSFGTHDENKQYFVKAYYELAQKDPTIHSLLQDMYDGPWIHPNQRTIAIEIAGTDFDNNFPSSQKTANALSVVWALMQRYYIISSRVLGHHEIQLNKGDPGKQFMATLRFLLGIKALIQPDPLMKLLVFGQYLGADGDMQKAVARYFRLARDYHVLTSKPDQVYAWEALSQYWPVQHLVDPNVTLLKTAGHFAAPIAGEFIKNGYEFLVPDNHEGIDLHHPIPRGAVRPEKPADVQLVAPGQCLYLGEVHDCHAGRMAIFRHQQPDNAQILSIYGHLSELGDLRAGQIYPAEAYIGRVDNNSIGCGRFLHFAVAYGAAWDLDLKEQPAIPSGAGPTWIRERYLEPVEYLQNRA